MKEDLQSDFIINVSVESERELDKEYEKLNIPQDDNDSNIWYDSRIVKDVSKGILKRLIIVTLVCISFIIVETIGAILSNSIAILTDVAHLASDLIGFMLSIIAMLIARKGATRRHTWGFARAEIIGAFCSVLIVWILTFWIYYEAFGRLINKSYGDLKPKYMLMTATFGIFANLVMMKSLHSGPGNHGGMGHGHSHDHGHEEENGHGHSHDHARFSSKKLHQKESKDRKSHFAGDDEEKAMLNVVQEEPHENENDHENPSKSKETGHAHDGVKCGGHDNSHEGKKSEGHDNSHDGDKAEGHGHAHDGTEGEGHEHAHDDKKTSSPKSIRVEKKENDHGHDHDGDHDHDHDHGHAKEGVIEVSETKNNQRQVNLSNANENHSENIRAAFIHIIGDLIGSIGVLIVALIIFFYPEWAILDPLLSIGFSTLALLITIPIMKSILENMLDVTPDMIDIDQFEYELKKINYLIEIHDLHIWQISIGKPSLTVHITCSDHTAYVLKKATVLARNYGIYHSTIQVEKEDRMFAINCAHNVH